MALGRGWCQQLLRCRWCLCFVLCSATLVAHAKLATVLVIDSYHQEYGWVASYHQGIAEELGSKAKLYYFQLDAKHLTPVELAQRVELGWQTYLAVQPDVVILADDAAVEQLAVRISEHGTPLVYFGVNSDPRNYGLLKLKRVSGYVERPLYRRSLAYLKEFLRPAPSRLLVIWDDSLTTHRALAESFAGGVAERVSGMLVEHRTVRQLSDWQQIILRSKEEGYSAVVIGLYQVVFDAEGKQVNDKVLLAWTAEHTPLPLFSFWDFAVGKRGAIGGLVVSAREQGQLAARRASMFLHQLVPPVYPDSEGSTSFVFSRSQMARWHVVLPPWIAEIATLVD